MTVENYRGRLALATNVTARAKLFVKRLLLGQQFNFMALVLSVLAITATIFVGGSLLLSSSALHQIALVLALIAVELFLFLLAWVVLRRWNNVLPRLQIVRNVASRLSAFAPKPAVRARSSAPKAPAAAPAAEPLTGDDATAKMSQALRAAIVRSPAPVIATMSREVLPKAQIFGPEPAVTVVVPLYNEERFVAQTIQSLKNQTMRYFEAIVVDDASTDQSAQAALRAIGSDPRFTFVRHQKNSGLSAARNTGLRLSRCDFVTFLDSDDLLLPDALASRLAKFNQLEDGRVAGVYCGVVSTGEDVDTSYRPPRLAYSGSVHTFISANGECPFNCHSPLLRTDVVRKFGGFDETLKHGCEDWDLWQRILRHGYWFHPSDSIAAIYRRKSESMVRTMPLEHLKTGRRIFDWAHSEIRPEDVVPGTPYVFTQGVSEYQREAIFAPRIAQFAAMAYMRDTDAFHSLLEDVPSGFVDYVECTGKLSRAVDAGLRRYLVADQQSISVLTADLKRCQDAVMAHLRTSSWRKANMASTPVAAERPKRINLFPANAKQAKIFCEIADQLAVSGISCHFVSVECVTGDQGVEDALIARGKTFTTYNRYVLRQGDLAAMLNVVMRPYTAVIRDLATPAEGKLVEVYDEASPVNMPDENLPATPSLRASAAEAAGVLKDASAAAFAGGRPASEPPEPRSQIGSLAPALIKAEERLELSPDYEKLLTFKNKFKGERCFIVGNGPSLNTLDLSKMKNDHVFAVNGIFYKSADMGFDPSFYVVEDSSVMNENVEAIIAYKAKYKFFPTLYRNLHPPQENTQFFLMNRGFYEKTSPAFCVPRFSLDAARRVYCGQSVTHINLQLAYYFGFSKVYLIGMDFSYVIPKSAIVKGDLILSTEDDVNHFHGSYFGAGKTWKDPKLHRVLLNYELARDIYQSDDRQVINATNGGKLEVFERADYNSLF